MNAEPGPRQDSAGPVDQLLARGAALQQAGSLDEAAALYRSVLAASPQHFDATHLLGVVALQQDRFADAQSLILSALALNPDDASAMGNLGTSFLRDGKPQAALPWLDRALELQPQSASALINAATALHNLGRYVEAIPLLRRALLADPGSYAVSNLLGACLIKYGSAREAADLFEAATRAKPDQAEGWANLAVVLNAIGQHARARECADRALSLHPDSPTAMAALATAQFDVGKVSESVATYRRALSVGTPTAQTLTGFAGALLACGLHDEAIEQLQRAMLLDDRNLAIRWAAALARLKAISTSVADVMESRSAFARAMDEVAAWYEEQQPETLHEPFSAVGIGMPFYLAYQPFSNRDLLVRHGALCAIFMSTLPSVGGASVRASRPGQKIRIGIASAHISDHSVWTAITKGWVSNLDRTKFEIHLFQLKNTSDLETESARTSVDRFEDQPTNLTAWAGAIGNSDLDVLIYPEIGMEPLTLQLAALRLAPLQAATWGHPETTGLPHMDLYISADALEPENAQRNYSETLVRLPNLGVYVEPLAPVRLAPNMRALKLPAREPLLLCPGSPFKYSPLFDDVWVGIARQLKKTMLRWRSGGRLVFFRSRSETMDASLEARLRAAFDRGGVDFDAHVSLIPMLDRPRFFGLMRRSALMLDTLGFSGFNTALQGIECDLPVLAYEGEFMRGRLASAIMRQLDLPELIATTPEEFVSKAVDLAGDPRKLKKLRALIIERRGRLFRDLAPVRALERHLEDAVRKSRAAAPAYASGASPPAAPSAEGLYAAATRAYEGQDFAGSIALYDRVLALCPDHAEAYFKRGNSQRNLGQLPAALESYEHAIRCRQDYAHAWCNRGAVQQALAMPGAALESYDHAIALDPTDAFAHTNLGSALQALLRWDAALASYDRALALDPRLYQTWFQRGNVLREMQRLEAASASYREAVNLRPDHAEAHYNLGVLLERTHQPQAAIASYDRAIAVFPELHQAHFNRAGVLRGLKEWEAALAGYDLAIAAKPDYAEAQLNRGVVLEELGRSAESLTAYDRAITLQPGEARGYFNRGNLLGRMDRWDEALENHAHAVRLQPDFADGHCGCGRGLLELNRLPEALAAFDRALALQPEFAEAQYNRALALLLSGDYQRGWPAYESRWKNAARLSMGEVPAAERPVWLGTEPIAGKTLLVHSEQGLGDTIQFSRFIRPVADRGARVVFVVDRPLVTLLSGLGGAARLIETGTPPPDADFRCPLLSLPGALGTTIDSIPAGRGYLTSDPVKTAAWRTRLGNRVRPRIGIAWSGNPRHGNDRNRSVGLADWIAHLPRDFDYICLQTQVRPRDQEILDANPWIARFGDHLRDFSDTAALCECLDLVVSVDTSVAHLSAALGRPTWILLSFNPDWRWLLDRNDSPWYPTATLYRQSRIGDWREVFERVARDLPRALEPTPR